MPRTATAPPASASPLATYHAKRDFSVTSEPRGEHPSRTGARTFVVQKHAASRLHYDFRLELDGVLVSWAVPKGPSYDPAHKRLAVHVEDHPLDYGRFEGAIPKGHYGAGTVIVWDQGHWEPVGDARAGLSRGRLRFRLHGQKLRGLWELVRTSRSGERQERWLLFKKRDEFARPHAEYDVVAALPDSVMSRPRAPSTSAPAPSVSSCDAEGLPQGAVKAPLPDKLSPQLATLVSQIPVGGPWIYEIKFDGYRMLARLARGRVRLFTRNGHDWSDKLPTLVEELTQLARDAGLEAGWLDGEVVAMDEGGLPSFNALQRAFDERAGTELTYFLFDVPFLAGHDLRQVPLGHRRELLRTVLAGPGAGAAYLRFSEDFDAAPATLLTSACNMNLEGVIAKRADAPYTSTRSDTWLKLKCKRRQEFVVCGYTDRADGTQRVGSLMLGVHDAQGRLLPVGSVGTGWDADEAQMLKTTLARIEVERPAFDAAAAKPGRWSRRAARVEHWVEPRLVAEVSFAEWTPDGQIRHASYVSLRTDKPAREIVRETAAPPPAADPAPRTQARRRTAAPDGLAITHGERVIDPGTGTTKLDLVRYYESVAEWILPHLKGRPVALVRAPQGIAGAQFFQRHVDGTAIPGIRQLDPTLWPGHGPLMEISDERGLIGAAQMNVIELHTWNAAARRIDQPDRMVFDLDPGEGVAWSLVQEGAGLVRALLEELGLRSWLKTSGGKGLHVVVPLAARYGDDVVKAFAKAIVAHLARTVPSRFVARSGPANRVGRIFVDYLRNGHGATTVSAFSARARPGMGVSMPVSWEELPDLTSGAHWTVATARQYLSFQTTDPWADYWKLRQPLKAAMDRLGHVPT